MSRERGRPGQFFGGEEENAILDHKRRRRVEATNDKTQNLKSPPKGKRDQKNKVHKKNTKDNKTKNVNEIYHSVFKVSQD